MTFKFVQIFTISCLTLLISVFPTYAVEINDAGAKDLKTMLSTHIENYKKSIQNSGGDLKPEGEITIEQGNGYYAATLPATTYQTAAGENIKIGLIAMNAIPTDNPNDWKISMAIPTPILIVDENDTTIRRIDIGEQNMGGLWSKKLEGFSKLKAHYNDIKFTNIEKGGFFNIDKVSLNSDLEEKKEGLWSGPTNFILSNFSAVKPNAEQAFALKEISAVIDIDDYAHHEIKKAKEKIQKMSKTEEKKDIGGHLFNILGSMGDFSAQFNLKNLEINSQTESNNLKAIDLIQFGYSSATPKDNNINQSFNIGYSGLQFKDQAEDLALIPRQFKTSLSLENFPLLEVVQFAEEAIGSNKDSSAKQVAATKAINFLPQKLKEAGTVLLLKNTSFGNPLYDVDINGELKAEASSKIGGTGFLNIETKGIDAVMKELQGTEKGAKYAQQLTMFRMISDEKGDKNVARIRLNEAGNVTVNDKDVSALMGGDAPAQ